MAIVVQKYGGTSLGDAERVRACAQRAVTAHAGGSQVVVVVSAMGHTTDELVALAGRVTETPTAREMDLLLTTGEQVSVALMAMAIRGMGVPAAGRAAGRLGITTSALHGDARIRSIETDRLRADLDDGCIVVVPGFQGTTVDGELTTLGRGGSDTTAVAIAAALGVRSGAGICEIYTDVDGVYTADPRHVPTARRLPRLSYEEMVELASLGAGILHTRAVLFGQRYGVPIHVRHSQRTDEGTMVLTENQAMEQASVIGCALTADLGRVTVHGLPRSGGAQATIFREIEAESVLVDDIMQIEHGDGVDLGFTVKAHRLGDLKIAVQRGLECLGAGAMTVDVGLSKISAVGAGMRSHSGVAATMFAALAEADIPIHNITTSEIKISCIVPREHGERGLGVVHEAFGLGRATPSRAVVTDVKA